MDLHEALLSRRTVYRYGDRQVAEHVLDRALEAARWAPNHKLTEPWRFYVVGPATRGRLGEVARRLAEEKAADASPEDKPALVERQVEKITRLPALLVVTSKRSPADPFVEREDYAATVCALHNAVLSLWGDGVGAQWSTGGITRDAETYRVLGVDPEAEDIIGFLKAGYPAEVPRTKRRALDEVTQRLP